LNEKCRWPIIQSILSVPGKRKTVIHLTLAGFAIRILLSPFSAHPFDMGIWYSISNYIATSLNIPNPSSTPPSLFIVISSTPAMFYVLIPLSKVYLFLAGIAHVSVIPITSFPGFIQSAAGWTAPSFQGIFVTNWLFNVLTKLPFILSDFGIALIVRRIATKYYGERAGIVSFALLFFNPMLIWVSSVWGMFDSIPAFFAILATYFVLTDRYSLCGISLAAGIGFKLYPFFFLVPMIYYAYSSTHSTRRLVVPTLTFGITSLTIFGLVLPYLPWVLQSYLNESAIDPTSHAVNPYGLTYWSVAALTSFASTTEANISLILFTVLGVGTTIISLLILRANHTPEALFFSQLLTTSSIFFSYLRVNEQWFVWLVPILVLLSVARRIEKKYVLAISFLAIAYSWISSLIAAFFIPTAYYNENLVEGLYSETSMLIPYRLYLMAGLGALFSALLLFLIFRANSKIRIYPRIPKS
jgi:hypothetical protein